MRKMLLVASCLLLMQCASSIMKSYEGKTIADVVIDYGPPINAFDMGDGRRAFQWNIQSSYTVPGHVSTVGTGSRGFYTSTSVVSPPTVINQSCNYTMFATRNSSGAQDSPAAWTVVGYAPPKLACE